MTSEAVLTAPGSTLGLDVYPTIGVEPGASWVGLAVRIGRECVDASTVGRAAVCGRVGGPEADRAWCEAIVSRIVELAGRHEQAAPEGLFRVAVRAVVQPACWNPTLPRNRSGQPFSREQAWNFTRTYGAYLAVLAAWPRAVAVLAPNAGRLHETARGGTGRTSDYYPPELIRARPATFARHDGMTAGSGGDRSHEQAAYVIAGLAELERERGEQA